jgi:hypothetical protein
VIYPSRAFSLALKLVITFIALLAATVKQKESDLFQGEQTTIRGALTEARHLTAESAPIVGFLMAVKQISNANLGSQTI